MELTIVFRMFCGWVLRCLDDFSRWVYPTVHYDLTGENSTRIFRQMDLRRKGE